MRHFPSVADVEAGSRLPLPRAGHPKQNSGLAGAAAPTAPVFVEGTVCACRLSRVLRERSSVEAALEVHGTRTVSLTSFVTRPLAITPRTVKRERLGLLDTRLQHDPRAAVPSLLLNSVHQRLGDPAASRGRIDEKVLDLNNVWLENPQSNASDRSVGLAASDPEDVFRSTCTCPCTLRVALRHLGFVSRQEPPRLVGHGVRSLDQHSLIEPDRRGRARPVASRSVGGAAVCAAFLLRWPAGQEAAACWTVVEILGCLPMVWWTSWSGRRRGATALRQWSQRSRRQRPWPATRSARWSWRPGRRDVRPRSQVR